MVDSTVYILRRFKQSLMNRLSQTVSAVFKLDVIFPKGVISDYIEITISVIVPCGGPKWSPRTSI